MAIDVTAILGPAFNVSITPEVPSIAITLIDDTLIQTISIIDDQDNFTLGVGASNGANTGVTVSSAFLPTPDEIDDTDSLYFYWGWISYLQGGWQIKRTTRISAAKANATELVNNQYVDLTSAWPNRTGLNYN